MTFSDIHQRVAAELPFERFLGQLCYSYECNLNDPDGAGDYPWHLTVEEHRCVEDNSRVMYLMVVGI